MDPEQNLNLKIGPKVFMRATWDAQMRGLVFG
jgi:hypothetical protein